MNPVFRVDRGDAAPVPAVFDSPHSGSIYPDDFDHVIDRLVLRRSEDAHIDELIAPAAGMGAALLHALFPRCYIDPNRHETDLDPDMIDGGWEAEINPSVKTLGRGIGLIWRRMGADGDIYDRRLTADEVRQRIERYWKPYHAALSNLIRETHARHGVCYHVDCHSMPARGDETTEDGPVDRADFVIGDRDGTSCEAGFTGMIVETLRAEGYWVEVNDPYKGVELVRRYSDPARGRHSIQVEVNRRLYMDERTLSKNARYQECERAITALIRAIVTYATERSR